MEEQIKSLSKRDKFRLVYGFSGELVCQHLKEQVKHLNEVYLSEVKKNPNDPNKEEKAIEVIYDLIF